MNSQDTRVLSALERIGLACAYIPLFIALFVLVGFALGIPAWPRLGFDKTFMGPNTAVLICTLCFGLLVRLQALGDRRKLVVSSILISFTALAATAVLFEYIFGLELGIDLLLFPAMVKQMAVNPVSLHLGRFALTTAIAFVCMSLAALGIDSSSGRERGVSQVLAVASAVLGFFFLNSYIFGAQIPENLVRHFASMAPPTALAIALLGCSLVLVRPSGNGAGILASRSLGGVMLWRLLPVALLSPFALGGLSVLSTRLGWFEPAYGITVIATFLATLFGGVVWWTAMQLDQFDTAARIQSKALSESEERYRNILDTANEGIWLLDIAARTSYVNKRLQEMLGYTAGEMLGRPLYDFIAGNFGTEVEAHFASRVEGKVESYDFQFQCKDGSTLWAIVNSTPLKDTAGRFNGVLKMITDITLRKQAEEEILRSTEALQRAQQVAHIGSWEWDIVSDRLAWSNELFRIYGVNPEKFEASFEAFLGCLHPDDRELVQRTVGNAFEHCSSFHFEHRILRPDGELRYLDGRGECIAGPDGKAALMRGTGQDITERKLAELALREAQEHFESVLQNAGMPISVKDLRGRYMLANPEAAEALGLGSASELIGKRDEELVPEMAERIRSTDLATMQTEDAVSVEEQLPGKEHPRQFWTTKFPMRDAHGTVVGVGAISQEITELRHAEQALRESESRNRSILEAALDAVVSMGIDGKIASWNRQAEELFGWKALEAIGQPITMIIPERYRDDHSQGLERFKRTGEAPVLGKVLQVEAKHRSGREFPVDLAIGQAASTDGEVSFSAFIRDISDRKRAEREVHEKSEQLGVLNTEMQVALQELANSHQLLQDQAAALERSNSDLDDFAYIASHDLKEPLRGISNYAHFLQEDYADKIDEAGQEMLGALPRLTKRLETLLDALLKYSRLNRAEVTPLPTNLGHVIDEVKELLHLRISENNVEVRVVRELPTIMCDRSQTTEIFMNLISNAIKYNDSPLKLVEIGYVEDPELGSQTEPHRKVMADGTGAVNQRDLIFYVSDNGIGIPEKHQETVFGAFRRLHSRDKYGGGTGVGLAIVKKMVERQGGRIWVESEPGQGSTFYFTLNPEVLPPGG